MNIQTEETMLQIDTSGSILIDGRDTGLKLTQHRDGSVIYTPESAASGRQYKEHAMPYARYSAAHDNPEPSAKFKTAGRAQLEADVRSLLAKHTGSP